MRHKPVYYIIVVAIIAMAVFIYKRDSSPIDMRSQVYEHYANDTLKLKAATFLIENMKWHDLQQTLVAYPDHIRNVVNGADSLYKFITQGLNNEILTRGETQGWLRHRASKYSLWRDTTFRFPTEYQQN